MLEPPWASLRAGPRHASRGRADGSDDRVITRASLGPGRASRACPPASPTCLAAPAPVPPRPPTPDPRASAAIRASSRQRLPQRRGANPLATRGASERADSSAENLKR